MPGVTVTMTNVDTNASTTLMTNSTGYYEAQLLLPGNYRVPAELVGLQNHGPHRPDARGGSADRRRPDASALGRSARPSP